MSYLERYQQGECLQVWAELEALGEQVRKEPTFSDAWVVTQETMRRVRHNLDLLIPRLQELGYVFGYAWAEPFDPNWARSKPPLRTPPPSDITQLITAFERSIGILPLSLRAFYEEIGGVNFVGSQTSMALSPTMSTTTGITSILSLWKRPTRNCLMPLLNGNLTMERIHNVL
jgi:hypothetical protein